MVAQSKCKKINHFLKASSEYLRTAEACRYLLSIKISLLWSLNAEI